MLLRYDFSHSRGHLSACAGPYATVETPQWIRCAVRVAARRLTFAYGACYGAQTGSDSHRRRVTNWVFHPSQLLRPHGGGMVSPVCVNACRPEGVALTQSAGITLDHPPLTSIADVTPKPNTWTQQSCSGISKQIE